MDDERIRAQQAIINYYETLLRDTSQIDELSRQIDALTIERQTLIDDTVAAPKRIKECRARIRRYGKKIAIEKNATRIEKIRKLKEELRRLEREE